MNTKQTGDHGEYLACEYLKKLGYKIMERNFRIRGGELDVIAKDPGGDLVFVEVKTRLTHEYGPPAEAVTSWKIKFLIRASQFYLLKYDLMNHPFRIDVVTVDFAEGQKLQHIKNITF